MRIAWYGPGAATPRQEAGLKELFGADTSIEFRGQIRNAEDGAADFRGSGCDDLVVIAPLAVLDHLLRQGIKPLWAEAEVVPASHPEAEWEVKGRHYRFVCFKRLTALTLQSETPKPLRVASQPVKVAWFTRHRCDAAQLAALQAMYGTEVQVVHQSREIHGPQDVAQAMKRVGATDCVLVAPLSIFDGLCKLGIQPLRGLMDGQRFLEFRRVTGLELQFELP